MSRELTPEESKQHAEYGNVELTEDDFANPMIAMDLYDKRVAERDALREVLKEAREQLAWLNQKEVLASTNVVLKRIDQALKT